MSIVQRQVISLSASQLKNLPTIPVVVIAAPGTGKAINVLSSVLIYNFGTTAYVGNGQFGLKQNASYFPAGYSMDITSPKSQYEFLRDAIDAPQDPIAVDNAPVSLVLLTNPPNTNLTGGDGTLKSIIYYTIEKTH